jgi:NADH/NAD ratio-sensing transcriptional regulator Rex
MFFTECGRLAEQHPDLARVLEQLDSQLGAMGTAEVIRSDDLASFLNIDPNQIRSSLDMFGQEGVLYRVEMIECTYCQMAAFRSDYFHCTSKSVL